VAKLTEGGALVDLITTLPVNERYSHVFQGNSQTLDHILVGGPMKAIDYDVVHINAEFFDQASDHDPQVVRIRPGK
jgi:predicted extracellular nuclease